MIVPRSSFTSVGDRRVTAACPPARALDLLDDPAFVTGTLGDLVDADDSQGDGAPLWVLSGLSIGGRQMRLVLEPTWSRRDDTVVIDALAVPPSDIDLTLGLENTVGAAPAGCLVHTAWRLRLWVPLPRPLASALTPALEASVDRVVDRIMGLIVDGIESA